MSNPLPPRFTGRLLIGALLVIPFILVALIPGQFLPNDPFASVAKPLMGPQGAYIFGTDDLGRDMFSAVLAGTKTSLMAGGLVAALAMVLGVCVGVISGFAGGVIDGVLMRLTELVQAMPRFFVVILMVALFGGSFTVLVLVLGLTSWPGLARITRAETLSLRQREFVRAAISLGGGWGWIIRRHILPHAARPVLSASAFIISSAILTEAGLSYLGISDLNVMSWGRLIYNAQGFLHQAWWLSVFPGLAIMVLVLGVTLLADGLIRE